MYARLYGAEEEATTELQEKTADLKIDNSEKADKAKEQPQPEKLDALQKEQLKKDKKKQARAEARVTIKRIERTKRKCVIVVAGMEAFDVDLKKAAKLFATKFACGSSVTKNAAGVEEIVVQGDVQDDIYELILKTYKAIPDESVVMD
ncbi:Translation machinery-associated protein 22 [Entophlyctis sp. JEL0112]|nr:Translation machinery-associated protein 22 [Entophlyctis sp. JEL0112]